MARGVTRLAALALAASASLALAQDSATTLDWLHGSWRGEGTMFGRPSQVRIDAGPALLGTASALTYSAEVAATADAPAFRFEGRGVYRVVPDGKVTGSWSDSQGNFHPLAGRISGQSMTMTWGEPRTEVGHSSYVLSTDGILTVTDSVMRQGAMRTFATATYRRAN